MDEILEKIGNLVFDTDYVHNPNLEDVIYGTDLVEGMVVLVDMNHRGQTSTTLYLGGSTSTKEMLDVANRWCEVSRIRRKDGEVIFIGLYADKMKAVRAYDENIGWLVKLTSIPSIEAHRIRLAKNDEAALEKVNQRVYPWTTLGIMGISE